MSHPSYAYFSTVVPPPDCHSDRDERLPRASYVYVTRAVTGPPSVGL
ncbi:MAG: hypothetical protein U0871_28270 [Gemmataceae bacterium]